MKRALYIMLFCAVNSQAEPEKSPVYVWQQHEAPQRVFMQNRGQKITISATTWPNALLLMADTARVAKCNGVINIRWTRTGPDKAEWIVLAELVNFRDPEKLDLQRVVVVK